MNRYLWEMGKWNKKIDTQSNTPVYPVIVGANCIRPPMIQVIFPINGADYFHHLK